MAQHRNTVPDSNKSLEKELAKQHLAWLNEEMKRWINETNEIIPKQQLHEILEWELCQSELSSPIRNPSGVRLTNSKSMKCFSLTPMDGMHGTMQSCTPEAKIAYLYLSSSLEWKIM